MATRFRPAKRRAPPPQIVGINKSNPIAKGLTFLGVVQGGVMVDLVTGQRGTPTGTTAPVRVNSGNGTNALNHAGGAVTVSYTDFGTNTQVRDMAMNGGSLFAWGKPTGQGGIAERNANNTVGAGWLFGIDSGMHLTLLCEYPVFNFSCGTMGAIPTDFPTSMAMTIEGQAVLVPNGVAIYIGGQAQTLQTFGTGSGGGLSDAAYNLYIGRNSYSSQAPASIIGSYTGDMEMIAFWNRRLSDAEIASLHQNRGQLFRQQRRMTLPLLGSTRQLPDAYQRGSGRGRSYRKAVKT